MGDHEREGVKSILRGWAAKIVYRLSGLLSRIKTPQRTYSMTWDDADDEPTFGPPTRLWLPCSASSKLLRLSERLDPHHWEHWALVHDARCFNPSWCATCGGTICGVELTDHSTTG